MHKEQKLSVNFGITFAHSEERQPAYLQNLIT